jgi:hypothetical protein
MEGRYLVSEAVLEPFPALQVKIHDFRISDKGHIHLKIKSTDGYHN